MTLILLLFTAAVISAPATAMNVQGVSHVTAPVAAGQYHHHAVDGAVTTNDAGDAGVPLSDDSPANTFGHSHVASLAVDVLQLGDALQPFLILSSDLHAAANTPALGTLGWSPQIRPPRTA